MKIAKFILILMTLIAILSPITTVLSMKRIRTMRKMNNCDYLFKAYNQFKGNPHAEGGVDPGFSTGSLFAITYKEKAKSGDNKWEIPDGTEFAMQKACSVTQTALRITGESSYKNSLEMDASIEGGFAGVTFSASMGFKYVSESTNKYKNSFVDAKAVCKVYKLQIPKVDPPKFSKRFKVWVTDLSKTTFEASRNKFFDFIDEYGTHFVREVEMGERYAFIEEMSQEEAYNRQQVAVSMGRSAGVEGFGSASWNISNDNEQSNSNTSKKNTKKYYSLGGNMPKDGNTLTWASQAKNDPMPVSYKLTPITELFSRNRFKWPENQYKNVHLGVVQNNLKKALDSYCEHLRSSVPWVNCGQVKKDIEYTPTAKPVYKIEDGNWYLYKNVMTKMCLSTDEHMKLFFFDCDQKNERQAFKLERIGNGMWRMISKVHPSATLDYVRLNWRNDHPNQKVQLVKNDDNTYTFKHSQDDLCLSPLNGNQAQYTKLEYERCMIGFHKFKYDPLPLL